MATKRQHGQRFEITGEWSGPSNPAGNWTRFVHREVTQDQKRAAWCEDNNIRYGDGTMLFLSVRAMDKGERAKDLKNGYGSLIDDCVEQDCNSVMGLVDRREWYARKRALATKSGGVK